MKRFMQVGVFSFAAAMMMATAALADQQMWDMLRSIQANGIHCQQNINNMLEAEYGTPEDRLQMQQYIAFMQQQQMMQAGQAGQQDLATIAVQTLQLSPAAMQAFQAIPPNAQETTLRLAISIANDARQGGQVGQNAILSFWNAWGQSARNPNCCVPAFSFVAMTAVSPYDPQFVQHVRAIQSLMR